MVKRLTYAREAERLSVEINKRLMRQGAKTVCTLRSDSETSEGTNLVGKPYQPIERYWLSFTRQNDGSLHHTTSVFANNAKDATKYLKGYLDAVCWDNDDQSGSW